MIVIVFLQLFILSSTVYSFSLRRASSKRLPALFSNTLGSVDIESKSKCNPSTSSSISSSISFWDWNGYTIRYTQAGKASDPPVILIHGFGASLDYYRKQIPAFAEAGFSVYALDLIGFGGSDKAIRPGGGGGGEGVGGYSAALWAKQVLDFSREIVKNQDIKPIIGGNSIGSRVALEVANTSPSAVRGLLLYNVAAGINNKFTITDTLTPLSLKLLAVPIFSILDWLLKNENFATWLFERTRKPENIRKTLQAVYINKAAVDDELVCSIVSAAEDPNALKVFVEILTNEPGATPDTFLDSIKCPIKLIWGDEDPFTPLDGPYGKYFTEQSQSRENISLSVIRGGHCPHDDYHEEANDAAIEWLRAQIL